MLRSGTGLVTGGIVDHSVGSDRRQVIGEIRMAILTVSYRRFIRALGNEERLLEEYAANTLLATLTDEQTAQLRRKHRGLISQADQQAQTSAAAVHSLTWMSASTPMMNNDFLTAVEIPSVQDKLQLTDEEVAAIEQAAVEADRVAAQTSHECIDRLLRQRTPFAAASAPVSPALQKLQQVTESVLTERQQQLYQEHMQGRQEAAQKLLASDPQKAQQLLFAIRPHGMTSESATHYERAGDAVTVVLKLTDYFATEDVAKTRGITADQQKKIADSIREAETELTRETKEAAWEQQRQQAEKHKFVKQKLDENLDATNQKTRALLTESQIAFLQKEKFGGLGIRSFRDPEVQSALELTDEQKLQIETILARKHEGIRNDLIRLTAFSQTDDFEKRSADMRKQSEELVKTQEENNRRYQEHTRTQHADLWKILSEEQIKTLRQMTNLITPATSATRI